MSSLTSIPISQLLRASDKLCFGLTQSDVGSDQIEKQGIYRLKCVDTGEWLMKQPSMFRGPKETTMDLMDIVSCRLRTKVPQVNDIGMFDDDTGKKTVELHYGEAIHDMDDCENNTCELTQISDPYTIVNSYCPPYELDPLANGNILATMPKRITVCQSTCDWIWICGTQTVTTTIKTSDGQTAINTYTTSGLKYISIGPKNIELGDGPASGLIDRNKISCIEITSDFQLVSTITVLKCCCEDDDQILFLDPKGSIRGMGGFDCIDSKQIQSNGSTICRQSKCNIGIVDAMAYYGQKYMAKETWESLTLSQKFCVTDDNEDFYRAFVSSPAYFIKRGELIVGFIPDSRPTTFKTDDDLTTITISGHIAWQFKTQTTN